MMNKGYCECMCGVTMKINGHKIEFKTNEDIFFKEKAGLKPNTARFMNTHEDLEEMKQFYDNFEKTCCGRITIINAQKPHMKFTRVITDITQFPGMPMYIISWKHKSD